MTSKPHISTEAFETTFPHLVSGRHLLPKKRNELRMLLVSTVSELSPDNDYSEVDINNCLRSWVARFGTELSVDHVTLRRYLVDEGILDRDTSGAVYSLVSDGKYFTYDESIRSVDLDALLVHAEAERASRKRAYLAKAAEKE